MTKSNRSSQIDRIYSIDALLQGRDVVPLQALLNALNVSASTVQRELKYMRERLRMPIEWNASAGGYCYNWPPEKSATPSIEPVRQRRSSQPKQGADQAAVKNKWARRVDRLCAIDQLLQGRAVVPTRQFLNALGVSPSTLRRDLHYMRDKLSAPIEWDRAKGGYCFAG